MQIYLFKSVFSSLLRCCSERRMIAALVFSSQADCAWWLHLRTHQVKRLYYGGFLHATNSRCTDLEHLHHSARKIFCISTIVTLHSGVCFCTHTSLCFFCFFFLFFFLVTWGDSETTTTLLTLHFLPPWLKLTKNRKRIIINKNKIVIIFFFFLKKIQLN